MELPTTPNINGPNPPPQNLAQTGATPSNVPKVTGMNTKQTSPQVKKAFADYIPSIYQLPRLTQLRQTIVQQQKQTLSVPYFRLQTQLKNEQKSTRERGFTTEVNISTQFPCEVARFLTLEVQYLNLLSDSLIKMTKLVKDDLLGQIPKGKEGSCYYFSNLGNVQALELSNTKTFSFFSYFISQGLTYLPTTLQNKKIPCLAHLDIFHVEKKRKALAPFTLDNDPNISATAQNLYAILKVLPTTLEIGNNQTERQRKLVYLEQDLKQAEVKKIVIRLTPALCWVAKADAYRWSPKNAPKGQLESKLNNIETYAKEITNLFQTLIATNYLTKRKQLYKMVRERIGKALNIEPSKTIAQQFPHIKDRPEFKLPTLEDFDNLTNQVVSQLKELNKLSTQKTKGKKKNLITQGIHSHPDFITKKQQRSITQTKQILQKGKEPFTYNLTPTISTHLPKKESLPALNTCEKKISFPSMIDRFLGSKELIHRFGLKHKQGYGLVVQYKEPPEKPVRGLFCYRIKDGVCLERFFAPTADKLLLAHAPQNLLAMFLETLYFEGKLPAPPRTHSNEGLEIGVDPHLGHVTITSNQGLVIEVMAFRNDLGNKS